jgi:hypothetical protein
MSIRNKHLIPIILVFLTVLVGCKPAWQVGLTVNDEEIGSITGEDVQFYIEKSEEEITSVPLAQFLYDQGFQLIDTVAIHCDDSDPAYYRWDDIAEDTALNADRELTVEDGSCLVESIDVSPSSTADHIELSIMDLAPTIANALGLPDLPDAIGSPWIETRVDHAVLIILDGTQYAKLQYESATDTLPFLASQLDHLQNGLTVYPPITTTASASLLTGAPPSDTGVYGYGYRTTELTTLFDLSVENGRTVHAVEGASLPFNLRNTDVTLSGDRDENGYSDDNVYANALDQIETNLPDLLYIHFHEIDDMGHSYGPESTEYLDAMMFVDGYLEGLYNALPESTLIVITADHGMHETVDGGNHGTLTQKDMIIPIIFLEK